MSSSHLLEDFANEVDPKIWELKYIYNKFAEDDCSPSEKEVEEIKEAMKGIDIALERMRVIYDKH